ncbi:MAG: hypothetical protein ACOH2V_00295 [Candidatus Saccharimonadaceae bacterium]
MEESLQKHGFKLSENVNEWCKANWTIRINTIGIEAFDEPKENSVGKYFSCIFKDLDIEQLIEEIDYMIKE